MADDFPQDVGGGQPSPGQPGGGAPQQPMQPPAWGGEQTGGAQSPAGGGGVQPPAGIPGGPPSPPKPPSPPANFQLGALLPPVLKVKIPPHTLKFDEQYFLHLLAGSISLTRDEKSRIIESIPKLKQSQIDELIRIFEEERRKFAELGQEHVPQLDKLAHQHYEDWMDIEMRQEQQHAQSQDEQKAEEIRKQLGL